MAQVLGLSRLPDGFAANVERIMQTNEPGELLSACEKLLETTRLLLLAEQRQVLCQPASFPDAFGSGYPELKADLHRVMLACEERDLFRLKGSFVSFYHELSRCLAQGFTGVEYSDFNGLSEYEQDLAALGFPVLLPYMLAEDFAGLHQQCLAFIQYLEQFLSERLVQLNTFATLDELSAHLSDYRNG
jgi:hypothetical protein